MEFKEYFQQPYQGGESFLQEVIFPIFGEENFESGYNAPILDQNPEYRNLAHSSGIQQIYNVGEIKGDFLSIRILDIAVTNHVQLNRNRVAIQQLVRKIMVAYSSAFMIFHYEDTKNWDWRFTFCSKKGGNDEITDSKRYTFLLGPNQSCRTASENFSKLLHKEGDIELKDIETAFDVEALSKEFFDKYKQQYLLFVNYMCDEANGMRQDFIDTSFEHNGLADNQIKEREEKPIRDYVKKMLGRIVFLHFLQKKGWMGVAPNKPWGEGDPNFMKHLFEKCSDQQKENFLDQVLEPLFSDALDKDRSDNDFLFDSGVTFDCGTIVKIPYLNGGLFERDSLDEPDSKFPAEYFDNLFDFFYQYNFTIDENDPNDAQVGVDPEMLGRIFENLLEDNKDKGAFYTPKEIVQYMCRQSLIAYLQTDSKDETTKAAIESFVKTYDIHFIGGADSELAQSLDKHLKEVKICDPAIGSGAFPMGLLKELFLCRGAIEKFDDAAEIKRHIIQQNVYGVDIEKGAVDIARLRFWLSLIVDEETPHSLPNLDYKIMQGNSLLEQYMGVDLSKLAVRKQEMFDNGIVLDLFDDMMDVYRKELREKITAYYSCCNHTQKHQLLTEIHANIMKQIDEQRLPLDLQGIDIQANDKFFLWHTWFSDVFNRPNGCNGFDIVIGNPPFLRIQGIRKSDDNLANLLSKSFKSATGSFDLYVTFVEKALDIIKGNGVVYFIMPVKWTNSSFGKGLRALLSNMSFASSIINFGSYQVFNASTYTGIQKFMKSDSLSYLELDRDLKSNTELDTYLNSLQKNDFVTIPYDTEEPWTLTNKEVHKVLEKLYKCPYKLSDVFEKIFQGIATSKDDVYFLYNCIEINECEIEGFSKYLQQRIIIEKGLVKPLLKGEDVHKYESIQSNRYIIFPYSLEQSDAILYTEQQLKDKFPHGYNYLKACEQELRGREKGRFNNDKWYMFGRGQGISYGGIPKLIAPEISLGGNFSYDVNGLYYSTTTIYGYIKRPEIKISYETLLAIMNSELCWWFLMNTGTVLANGYFRYKPTYLKPFPLPNISQEDDKNICNLVKQRMNNISLDNNLVIDHKINNYIYNMYNLSHEEIEIISEKKQ